MYFMLFDLGKRIGGQYHGLKFCLKIISASAKTYTAVLFVLLFCIPVLFCAIMLINISLKFNNFALRFEIDDKLKSNLMENENSSENTPCVSENARWSSKDGVSFTRRMSNLSGLRIKRRQSRRQSVVSAIILDDELDLVKESRNNHFLITMFVIFAVCLLPGNIISLVTHFMFESNNLVDDGDFNLFLFGSLCGYIPSCTNPILFILWQRVDQNAVEENCFKVTLINSSEHGIVHSHCIPKVRIDTVEYNNVNTSEDISAYFP